jgi:hypothetical protein
MELLDTIQIQQLPLQFKFEAQLKMDVYSGCCSKKKGGLWRTMGMYIHKNAQNHLQITIS